MLNWSPCYVNEIQCETLDEAIRIAPRLNSFTESQYIIGMLDKCRLVHIHGPIAWIAAVNGEAIWAYRSFDACGYSNDHQGAWHYTEAVK
jgi:hypothetical protein